MVASVSRISRVIDFSTTLMSQVVVAGADDTPPSGFITTPGINGSSNRNHFENAETATTAGYWYSVYSDFTEVSTIDMSVQGAAFFIHFRVNGTYNNVDGLRIALRSGAGNWGIWEFSPISTAELQIYRPYRCEGVPGSTIGTFNAASVDGVAVLFRASNADVYAMSVWVDQPIYVNGSISLEDSGAASQVAFSDYFSLLRETSTETYRSLIIQRAGTTYESGCGIEFNSDNYQDATATTTLFFASSDRINYAPVSDGFYRAMITPPANGVQVFNGFVVATGVEAGFPQTCDMIVDASAASCTADFSASTFANIRNANYSGAGLSIESSNIIDPVSVNLADLDSVLTISNPVNPVALDAPLAAGSTLTTDGDITITFAGTDLSATTINLTASNTLTVTPSAGGETYDLSGLTTSGTVTIDNATAFAVTVIIPPGTSFINADPGTITISNAASVNLKVTVYDLSDGSPVQNARVRLTAAAGGPETLGTVLLEGLTDVNGELTASYNYTSDQPVTGTVRKASAAPYFKPGTLSGSITASGYDVPVNLVRD